MYAQWNLSASHEAGRHQPFCVHRGPGLLPGGAVLPHYQEADADATLSPGEGTERTGAMSSSV